MIVWLLPTFTIIFGLIILGITIFISIRMNRNTSKIDVTPNAPIIDMTARRQFTEGYCHGLVKRETPCKNGTSRFEVIPTDIKQGEDIPMPKVQVFIVAKQFIKRIAQGEKSPDRNEVLILPRSSADLPESIRETDYGKWLSKEGQLAYMERLGTEQIKAGDEALEDHLRNTNRTGVATGIISQLRETLNKINEAVKDKNKEEEKSGTDTN